MCKFLTTFSLGQHLFRMYSGIDSVRHITEVLENVIAWSSWPWFSHIFVTFGSSSVAPIVWGFLSSTIKYYVTNDVTRSRKFFYGSSDLFSSSLAVFTFLAILLFADVCMHVCLVKCQHSFHLFKVSFSRTSLQTSWYVKPNVKVLYFLTLPLVFITRTMVFLIWNCLRRCPRPAHHSPAFS